MGTQGSDELRELASDAMSRAGDGQPKEKRIKLKAYDQMSAQVFNPNGESGIHKTALDKLAKAMAAGNKAAAYFSELCDPMPKRKGVAISRLAEVQLLNGEKLHEPVYKKHINKELYDKAIKEFKELKPAFTVLMGKGLSMEDDDTAETVGRIAYAGSSSGDFRNAEDVNLAAKKVYAWLQKPSSELRQLTAFLSGGGLFYVSSVHEKCHRAYIKHGYTNSENAPTEATEEMYATWARARLCSSQTGPTPSDLDGLM
jgi:hypothetical protein